MGSWKGLQGWGFGGGGSIRMGSLESKGGISERMR
jgi:hypothetical protein